MQPTATLWIQFVPPVPGKGGGWRAQAHQTPVSGSYRIQVPVPVELSKKEIHVTVEAAL